MRRFREQQADKLVDKSGIPKIATTSVHFGLVSVPKCVI